MAYDSDWDDEFLSDISCITTCTEKRKPESDDVKVSVRLHDGHFCEIFCYNNNEFANKDIDLLWKSYVNVHNGETRINLTCNDEEGTQTIAIDKGVKVARSITSLYELFSKGDDYFYNKFIHTLTDYNLTDLIILCAFYEKWKLHYNTNNNLDIEV